MGWGSLAVTLCEQEEASAWRAVANDVCNSQSSSDQLVEEADALASDSEGEVQPEPRAGFSEKVWWARQLERHTLRLGYESPAAPRQPVNLVSCCSGAVSEGIVLKELGIPARIISTSEPNSDYRCFQQANHKVEHVFEFLSAQVAGNKCLSHKHEPGVPCKVPDRIDLMVVGSPCNPFSKLTKKRFHADSVQNHRLFDVTFKDVCESFQAFEPVAGIMEQSAGFGMVVDCHTTETPLQRFLDVFKQLSFTKGGYWIVVIKTDLSEWINISRERIYINFFRKDVYTREEAAKFKEIVKAVQDRQRQEGCASIARFFMEPDDPVLMADLERMKQESRNHGSAKQSGLCSWSVQVAEMKGKLGVSPMYEPVRCFKKWHLPGLEKNERIKAILNMAVCEKMKDMKKCASNVKKVSRELLVDVSQNPARARMTNASGLNFTLCTSTVAVHMGLQRLVVPREYLYLQGFPKTICLPDAVPLASIKKMAGEGMALPSLGLCVWCQYLLKGYKHDERIDD